MMLNVNLRRMPTGFYILAVVMFAWSLSNAFWEIGLNSPYDGGDDRLIRLAKSKALFQAVIEATYMAGTGGIIHALIAIWDRLGLRSNAEATE